MNNESQAKMLIRKLKDAIKNEQKERITALFDVAELIDWHEVHDSVFTQYDALLDPANEVLLTT
ncbi:hypothetical protein [Psychroflexus sp. ALD_RP9]|uniref:hypothetical protein n=1 Tax=Psychroflexus sp. ALD_RP9 TaxID=2777186 RepID=UPI001A8E3A0E|nr:hypothetical protein [Psychroflexus sp. ALD_RP9]QSS96614.1 hypothetical protein IMZ30_09190 [Psychroflexus sp. ALD_RP9]